jgi:hypothetical protein
MAKFLEAPNGDKSSNRLFTLVIVCVALLDVQVILLMGYIEKSGLMVTVTAATTLFTGLAGIALYSLYQNKKSEPK